MTINLSWPSKDPLTPCGQAKSVAVQLLLLSAQVGGRIIRKLATTMLQEGIPDDVYIQSSRFQPLAAAVLIPRKSPLSLLCCLQPREQWLYWKPAEKLCQEELKTWSNAKMSSRSLRAVCEIVSLMMV